MQGREHLPSLGSVRHDLIVDTINDSFFTATLEALWREWTTLFSASSPNIPQKSQISMKSLKTILPYVVITQLHQNGTIVIRLAGTGLEEIASRPLTGLNTLDLTPKNQGDMVMRAYANMANFRCGLFIRERIEFKRGADADLHTLTLPLADEEGATRFFIGVYDFGTSQFAADNTHRASTFRHKWFDQISYIDLGFGCPTP